MNMVSELVIHRTRLEQISLSHRIPELNETLEQVARSTFRSSRLGYEDKNASIRCSI